jgi:hypothetical protein
VLPTGLDEPGTEGFEAQSTEDRDALCPSPAKGVLRDLFKTLSKSMHFSLFMAGKKLLRPPHFIS